MAATARDSDQSRNGSPASSVHIGSIRSRQNSHASSTLRPRSLSSSSASSSTSMPISPIMGGSNNVWLLPTFTTSSLMRSGQSNTVPIIHELPNSEQSVSDNDGNNNNNHDDDDDDTASDSESLSESEPDPEAVVSRTSFSSEAGRALAPLPSTNSSTDSLSTLASSVTSSSSRVFPANSFTPSVAGISTHSVPRRQVPSLANTKFTSLSSYNNASDSKEHSSQHVLSPNKVTSGSRSASTISLGHHEDGVATTSKGRNRLRRKSSAASISSMASKAKGGSSAAGASVVSVAASFSSRAREHASGFSKSRFFFLQGRHSSMSSSSPVPPVLTGGSRQNVHHYKVLPPGEAYMPSTPASSGSSSESSTTSLNALNQSQTSNSSQQTLFAPKIKGDLKSKKSNGDKDRRHSIGSNVSPPSFHSHASSATLADKHKHHLLLRPRKDSHPGMILSSSSSNSKLTSDAGSIYSFNPSSPIYAPYALQKSISSIDIKSLSYKELNKIGEQALEDVWPFLCARVTPLFTGDGLRVPVEDLNKLVLLHVKRRISDRDATTLLIEVKDLLKLGISSFDAMLGPQLQNATDSEVLDRITDIWKFFFTDVLPYVQAVFVPLQLEFDGKGSLITADEAIRFWDRQRVQAKHQNNIRIMTLVSFRDWIILPLYLKIKTGLDSDSQLYISLDSLSRLLQCMSILASINSTDDKQHRIDEISALVRKRWTTMRTTKNLPKYQKLFTPVE
ncbi:HbrB-like-domain-containing protein [Lipomyces japonicus]|uniref:HbrB-like-domain-containing protein n=1 Tax=Lipomyces japonicus TaxID=56871 RepID=UPI0034CD4E77